jgi:hypothetical protein
MKISILGAGNAGCVSALHFYFYKLQLNFNVEIELIYDPNIKPVPTGQGTTLDFPKLLSPALLTNFVTNFPTTIKTGIMYEGWSNKEKIFHGFTHGGYGVHFNPQEFQEFVCKNLNIKFIQSKIIDYNFVDSDYIIDCRGAPKELDNYEKLINPLNCALLGNLDKKDNDVLWTRTIATPDGWCFYIPLPDTTSVGYIYNSSITKEEKAKNNFKNLFKNIKINQVFPFKQYLAKEPIIDDRVLLNGNKLFFLEPLEATAVGAYINTCRFYWDYIFNGHKKQDINFNIKKYIYEIQNFILWHYKKGSKYKTSFWKHAIELYKKNDNREIEHIVKILKSMNKENEQKAFHSSRIKYGQWEEWSFMNWWRGMEGK